MKLFEWRSQALSAYAPGYLITAAGDIEQAKDNVRQQFEREFFELFLHLNKNYEEDWKDIADLWENLENDLLKEPNIYEIGHTFLIRGSD